MKGKLYVMGAILGILLSGGPAQAMIVINEIHADPAAGLAGDANADGVRSSSADEFVELFNMGTTGVDLSGWSIADAAATRHVFGADSVIDAGGHVVVFGGGSPALPDVNWVTASTGGLSLNNSSDTLFVFGAAGELIDSFEYDGLAAQDQSIVRSPEGSGTFRLHTELSDQLFSPGVWTETDGTGPVTSAVPEPSTLMTFLAGAIISATRKRFI